MAKLTINGRQVTVDDGFLKLSPQEQEAAVEEIASSLGTGRAPIYENAPDMTGVSGIMAAPSTGENITPAQLAGKIARGADDTARLLARGATFGMADRLAAGGNAILGRGTYDDNLKEEVGKTQAAHGRLGVLGTGLEMAGGIGTGVGLASKGVTLAGRTGPGLLRRMLGFGAEGAAYGAVQGAGTNYGTPDEKVEAAQDGARVGFGLGAAMPAAGAAIGRGYSIAHSLIKPSVPGLRGSAGALLDAAVTSDPNAFRQLARLGPEASIADANGATRAMAQGVSVARNISGSRLVEMLRQRDARTGQRLASATDANLGPRVLPSQVDAGIRQARRDLGPQYEAVLANGRAVDTAPLAQRLDVLAINERGAAQKAAMDVRRMLNIPDNPAALDPSPRALFSTRKAIDGRLRKVERSGDSNVLDLLGSARREVDSELAAQVPGIKAVDGQFAELAAQREALQRGQEVFDIARASYQRPEEVAQGLAQSALPRSSTQVGPSAAPMRMTQGARAEVDRLVATGTDDLRALENTFRKDANAQKLGILFGEDPGNALVEAIAANRRMRDTYNLVDRGSQTAQRQAAQEAVTNGKVNMPPVHEWPTKAFNVLINAAVGRTTQRNVQALDDVLSRQGSERDAIIQALLAAGAGRQGTTNSIVKALVNPGYLAGPAPALASERRTDR